MAHQHMPAIFIANAAGLNFLNSIATPVDGVVDRLNGGDGLMDWLAQSKLVPSETLMPEELDKVAEQARDLRQWLRAFIQEHQGRPLLGVDLSNLAPLSKLLERDESYKQLIQLAGGGRLALHATRRRHSPESLLIPIGEKLAQLVTEEDLQTRKVAKARPVCSFSLTIRADARAAGTAWQYAETALNRLLTGTERSASTN
jgi:hypothetical protein